MVLSFAQAELIGLILHSCLFGFYLFLFFSSLPFDIDAEFNVRPKPYNTVLLTSNALLFMLIFAHWVVQIIRSQRAFIDTVGEAGDAASAYYAFPADYMNLLKESLYLAQTFVGDCTMIYRLWIVYNKKIIVTIVPIIIMAVYATSAIAVVIALGKTTLGENIFISTAGVWAIMVFSTTVATNVLTTTLITARIWSIKRKVRGMALQTSGLASVLHIIIESAALYTTTALLTLIGYSTEQTWQFITIDMISPIIGISFTLISVRVSRSTPSQAAYSTHDTPSSNVVRIRGVESRREAIGLDTISVNVTQHVSKHTDLEDGMLHGGAGEDSISDSDQKRHF
ncbi:hypothetical protein EV361DRAFT_945379 [Lentinula raphanica]|nr:hypothetical protein C8R42DRAFT_722464 [Lentinula raphanica]KAJ3778049.1 hypothetical protein FB446DRAFT_783755 [Lentinula raphanica]KAJ3817420.1 hypothetical protein F5880DRAFT_1618286 [Lentinula raphanica]KAJ3976321.1 hypothetical protein EV361DRAFT_945379 [Lentinula raphanica]